MAIDKIDLQITPTPAPPTKTDPTTFASRADAFLTWIYTFSIDIQNFISKLNIFTAQTNATETAINTMQTSINKTNEDIDFKKIDIDIKHNEIMSYTIPTEATYNTATIDDKVRMSQILNMTNSI